MHAMIGQDVCPPIGRGAPLRPDAYQREVGRATADVGNEHERLARRAGLEVARRGDGFELELDGFEPGGTRRLRQRFLRACVAYRIIVDEINRPPQDDTPQFRVELALRYLAIRRK